MNKKQKTSDNTSYKPKLFQLSSCLDDGITASMVIRAYNKLQIAKEMLRSPRKFSDFLERFGSYKCVLASDDYIKANPQQLLLGIDNTKQSISEPMIRLTEVGVNFLGKDKVYIMSRVSIPKYKNIYYNQQDGINIFVVNSSRQIIDYLFDLSKNDDQVQSIIQDTITWYINNKNNADNQNGNFDPRKVAENDEETFKDILHKAMKEKPNFRPIINVYYDKIKCISFIRKYKEPNICNFLQNIDSKSYKDITLVILSLRTTSSSPYCVIVENAKNRIEAAQEILKSVNTIDLNRYNKDNSTIAKKYHKILSCNSYVGLYTFTPDTLLNRIKETQMDGDSSAAIRINKLEIEMDLCQKE